jgi:hypothetical protein
MNLMGKIFTLLIFFMSICFLVVAVMVGASHRNWKQIATVNKEAADRYQGLLNDAKKSATDKDQLLNAERVARAFQLSQLESQLAVAIQNRDDKEKLLLAEQKLSTGYATRMAEAESRLAEQDTEVAQLKTQNSKLVDDIAAQRSSVVNLTNQVFTAEGENERKEQMVRDLTEQLATKTKVMKANGLTDDALTAHIPPKLDGLVMGVSDDVVVVSLGTDDGIRKGHVLDIYRGDRYIGKAVVTIAQFDKSAARISPDFRRDLVQEGDHVTTKF